MADEHLLSLQPGTVIAGRYEVVKCLGAGSMGLVYACRHRELSGHLVAVKVLFPEVAQDTIAAQRFKNEIAASYGVSHPNVVRAYEYLRDGDILAYTMEFVGGGDLADRLGKQNEAIPVSEMVRLYIQMCSGVQAIHDAGIVHRDLKPENILLTKNGDVKIADFGIARTGHGPKLTEHGGVVGTIDYVSPEYMLNSQVDWRSDIYALGILGYEMLVGESPFRGDSVYETMTKRLKSDPNPPSSFRTDCPQELDRIILRAMNRDPEQRYQSAAEIVDDLDGMIVAEGLSVARAKRPRSSSGAYGGGHHAPNGAAHTAQDMIDTAPQSELISPSYQPGPRRPGAETQFISPTSAAVQQARVPASAVVHNTSPGTEPTKVVRNNNSRDPDDTQEVDVLPMTPVPRLNTQPSPLVQQGFDRSNPSGWVTTTARQHPPVRPPAGAPYPAQSSGDFWEKVEAFFSSAAWETVKSYPQTHFNLSWFDILTIVVALFIGVGFGFFLLSLISG